MELQHIFSMQTLYDLIDRLPVTSIESVLSAFFHYCGLFPTTVYLHDNKTTMTIWAADHRSCHKPNLVVIHGFGGNSKWQFILQVTQLTRDFNVYMPDLVFFGGSYTTKAERSVTFQAECVYGGMKKMGVEKFSVYAISYGGFVGYRMAELHQKTVEKVVIVSSGIVCRQDRKLDHLKTIGRNVVDLLVAKTPEDLRVMCRMSIYKFDIGRWIPDFFLRGFIAFEGCKKEKKELVEELLAENPDGDLPILTQV